MNGQRGRRRMVRDLCTFMDPDYIVETGTFRGGSTGFLADVGSCQVFSVEASERFYTFARWRLRRNDVHLTLGDSREFLAGLPLGEDARILFYLDAHWEHDLPLVGEISVIAGRWKESCIVVDDFEVPWDSGYAFDDYGPGASLTASILPDAVDDWHRLYPSLPSQEEDGARRGCLVLVPPTQDPVEVGKACGLVGHGSED